MVGLDRLIGGFESVDLLVVALFDGGLIWFWFDDGLTGVEFFFFFFFSYLLWPMLEVEGERGKGKEREIGVVALAWLLARSK